MARYFMPSPDDGRMRKIWTWIRTGKRFRPSFPRAVQFQTLSTCNARCVFCPHCHYPQDIPHGRMEDALILKIIAECKKHFVGRVSPYLTNEPLMDKRMPKILAEIKTGRGFAIKTKINTNAALLTEEVGKGLINARLDQLWISINGYSQGTYWHSMGLDLAGTKANVDGFLSLQKRLGRTRPKVVVTTLRTKLVEHELDEARRYWKAKKIEFHIHHMDNRAGDVVAGASRPESARFTPKRNCDLFLKQAYIVENGDMILCCHDWRQSVVIGNVRSRSIAEVWNSERFKKLIYEYYAEQYDELEICRHCG